MSTQGTISLIAAGSTRVGLWDKFCEDYRHGSVLPEEVDGRYTLGTYDDDVEWL